MTTETTKTAPGEKEEAVLNLRELFLAGKLEAFRERGARMAAADWGETADGQSLRLLYETVTLGEHEDVDAARRRLIEQVGEWVEAPPEDASSEAVSEVALAAMMLGELGAAAALLEEALDREPVSAYAWFRAGTLAAIEDDHAAAIERLKKGLELAPARAEAWANLAHVYRQQGDEAAAREAYVKGWELRPAHRDLGQKAIAALKAADELDAYGEKVEAEIATLEASRPLDGAQRTRLAQLLAQKAQLAEEAGERTELVAAVQQAAMLAEEDEEIRRLFIDTLMAEERYWVLGQRLKAWVEKYDVFYEHLALAQCRIEAGFVAAAKEGLEAVKDRAFGDPEWDNLWAQALMEEGDYEAARAVLERVHGKHPDYVPTINLLADVLASLGELERASELTQQAADRAPGPLIRLLENKKKPTAEDVERLEAWLERLEGDEQAQANIRFTLAHVQDRLKDYAQASENIRLANEAVWRTLEYDPAEFSAEVDALIAGVDETWLERHQNARAFDVQPVFIVGMPRSGTTLLEQIFAAHPAVHGGGELPIMGRIRRLSERITERDYPRSMLEAEPELIADAGEYYLDQAKRTLGFEAPVLVDKLPHNFMDAALILAMFPNARVIALRRDYRAIALSNYFQNFAAKRGLLGYAFDLEATGRHLVDFHRLMNHWKKVLPADRYREFYYEELVSDPKKTIPEVLDFCGLDFTPEVMAFYRNRTAVRTASVRQVRNPIYQGSKAKWRHYEDLLAPTIEIVEGSGVAPYRYDR